MNSLSRCKWCEGDPLLEEYHDKEWGILAKSDDELFERMSLQIFQAGLNWKLILQKRKNICEAFAGFRIDLVSRFTDDDYHALLNNPGILRNRQKIGAVLQNAKAIVEIREKHGSFQNYLDSIPTELSEYRKEFRKTFKFMGPEITRMFVFNIGKITPPHEPQCWRHPESSRK